MALPGTKKEESALESYVIGIDGGTGGTRAFVFDAAGNVLGQSTAPYETLYPQSGWAEQRPADWIAALTASVRAAVAAAGIQPGQVAALAAATTSCTVLTCTADGSAPDPAIMWMDMRAAEQARFIGERTGERPSAELYPCKAMWIRDNQPRRFAAADVVCEYQDYLNHWLTGRWCCSVNTTCNWGYNRRRGSFDAAFYQAIGFSELLEKIPQTVLPAGAVIGPLRPEAAAALGLPESVLVAQGGIDSSIGMLGMGAVGPGTAALMTGSSNLLMALTEQPLFTSPEAFNAGPDFLIPGYYSSFGGQTSSGSILRWFQREFCRDLGPDALAELDALAKEVPCGSNGVQVLDYWQGNRMPHNDPDVRGLIYGLSMNTTREMVFRAVMEGVACGTEEILRTFAAHGNPIRALSISGGTTRSPLFLQIHADVSGIPFQVTSDYSVALGSGICAACAAGWYEDLAGAAGQMVRYAGVVQPDPERHQRYRQVFDRYHALYQAIAPWVHAPAGSQS